jgi:glycosyltransferase involved in cell wall biosynthesis
MKRILLGVTYYYPNISGVSEYAKILAEELGKKNKLEVISGKFKNNLENFEKINGVDVLRINGSQIGKGFLMWSYPIVSCRLVKSNDIINCHLPSLEAFWLALWAKIFHKNLIVTHHCEFAFNGTFSNILIALLSFPSHFFTYLWADKIVAYTKDYADNSMFLKMFKKKLVFILPPIKLEDKPTPNPSLINGGENNIFIKKIGGKNIYINNNQEKVVGYVGRIAWEKGLTYLIEAMKNIDAKLILAGPYKDVVGDNTFEMIKNNLNKNIKLIGPIDHEKLKDFYTKLDCLVLPSINNLETFGIVQAEAMKCGIPVVASNLPGVRVPVKMTGMGEICEIKNSKDLANKISFVLKNGKIYYQKRTKNLEMFDYQKTVTAYGKLF